jgi:hypothetical protein
LTSNYPTLTDRINHGRLGNRPLLTGLTYGTISPSPGPANRSGQ